MAQELYQRVKALYFHPPAGCNYDLEVTSVDPERCPSSEQCPKCLMCKVHCKSGEQGGCGDSPESVENSQEVKHENVTA